MSLETLLARYMLAQKIAVKKKSIYHPGVSVGFLYFRKMAKTRWSGTTTFPWSVQAGSRSSTRKIRTGEE